MHFAQEAKELVAAARAPVPPAEEVVRAVQGVAKDFLPVIGVIIVIAIIVGGAWLLLKKEEILKKKK
jgi:hypothetical protein